jgi:hypothetical protein
MRPAVIAASVVALVVATVGFATAAKKPRTEIDRYRVGVFPIDIAVGDFNRDRRADLAVSIFQTPSGTNFPISILRGTRKGSFRKTRGVKLDQQPHGIAVARLGSGKDQDLVIGTLGDEVVLFKGRKGLRFGPPKELAIADWPRRVASADFDQDGRADIAASRQQANDVAVVLGLGGLGFGAPSTYPVGLGGGPIVATRIDPGGDPDLLTVDYATDSLALLRGQAGGAFGAPEPLAVPSEPRSIAVADLDRDGHRDLIAGFVGDRPRLAVLRGQPGGTFAPAQTLAVGRRPMDVSDIAVTRVDRNRDPDLVIAGRQVGGVRIGARGIGPPGPIPKGRVLVLEGRAGIKLRRVRQFTVTGAPTAAVAARIDRKRPVDIAASLSRDQRPGRVLAIRNP